MKISDHIKRLEHLKEELGDLEIRAVSRDKEGEPAQVVFTIAKERYVLIYGA